MGTSLLLALDFDGVLHPKQAGGPHFVPQCCDLVADILDAVPPVDILLTTTWKDAYPLARLKTLLPARLGARVIATAPSLDPNLAAVREKEVLAFLSTTSGYTKWVALDDDASLFRPGCANLVLCNPQRGFSVNDAPSLWSKLAG